MASARGVIEDPEDGEGDPSFKLLANLGRNLRRLRTRRGYSLERFSKCCGVSRGMLGQIETGKSMPSIGVIWKIANALDIPMAHLLSVKNERGSYVLRRNDAAILSSDDGKFHSRALFPFDLKGDTEFYEVIIAPLHIHRSEAHMPGTKENLVVVSGQLQIDCGNGGPLTLSKGDAAYFDADTPHSYHNLSDIEAVVYLVMTCERL